MAALAWLTSDRYLGLGIPTLEASILGAWVPWDAALLKILFTSLSLGTGGSGGIVTPIFFIGATAGNALGALLGFDRGTFAAIGMVSLLAGAANAPLSASIMAIELFGPAGAPYAAMSCVVSFLIVGHRSVYPSQILGMSKARSVRVQAGAELGSVRGVDVRRVRLRRTAAILKALRKRRGKIPRRPA